MKKVNEGQTQVYANGMITPQYGVDTTAPYLNTPPKQLMDLTHEFFKSGKSQAQVLAILVGMGTPQQLAQAAIYAYGALGAMQEKHQKNNMKMKFTLVDLYEKVVTTIEKLDEMSADKSRTSYSLKQAKDLLEGSLKMFPDLSLTKGISSKMSKEDAQAIKEDVESKVSPNLKYAIAKSIHRSAAIHDWMQPISELRSYIDKLHTANRWSFRINEAVESISRRNNPMDTKLAGELTSLIKESEDVAKAGFERVAAANPWSAECKAIVNEMKQEAKGADQARAKVTRIFTPMLSEGGKVAFHLHGKTWSFDGKKVEETRVADPRFGQVLEALAMFKDNGESLIMFGESGKALEINVGEGTIKLGSMDITNMDAFAVKEALLANKFFSFREAWKADKIAGLVEHFDMVGEMDNALGLTSTEFLNVYLTMLAVEEGVWVNKVNPAMKLNEMKFFKTATAALKEAKDFIGYDATAYLAEALVAEGHKTALVERKRAAINSEITFLEEKKAQINAAISRIGKSEELSEALGLVEAEMTKKEKELQSTYVSEKKTKLDYLNDGYVEAVVDRPVATFKKGDEVMVNAEEYSSLGDDDLIDVVNPKTMESELIERGKLKVKI